MDDCPHLERTHLLADGELSAADAEAAREHVAGCEPCQAELAEIVQLDVAVAAVSAPAVQQKEAPIISLAWYRRRSVQVTVGAMAAAASVALYLGMRSSEGPATSEPKPVAVALASHRALEARVSWGDAAKYRAYDVPRGDAAHETIGLAALAELEQRGDREGVGVLALLEGDRKRAASYLEKAGQTADVLADRAAVALAEGAPARSLVYADAALALAPAHGAATWNRALALRDLGLMKSAAEMFRAVAARGEPGWSDEATARAAALDAEFDANEQRLERINQASAGNAPLTTDDARAQPGLARVVVYDAIRSAATPDAFAKLAPLAAALDEADRDTAMANALARAQAAPQPELATIYGQIVRALAVEQELAPKRGDEVPVPSGAARQQLLARLRAAHADDLLLGLLLKTSSDRYSVDRGDIAEFAKLAAASPDPWMQLLGLSQQAQVATRSDDLVGAEAILLRAQERCRAPGAPAYRCILIEKSLAKLYINWQRLPEARAALMSAWGKARSSGEWILESDILPQLARLAELGDDAEGSGLPLARAYVREDYLRYPVSAKRARCEAAARGRTLIATILINQLHFEAARSELAGPACPGPREPIIVANELFVRAELAHTPAEVAALRADIAALRDKAGATERIMLDHAEGRAIVESDRAAGEALLERAISAANRLPTATWAHRMAAYSYAVLAVAAAKRGDGATVLGTLAEEQGIAPPERCVVGIAIEDRRRAIAARDSNGSVHVHYDEARTSPAIDSATLVPADIRGGLAGCAAIDVIARAPIHGMPRLFGDDVAWRYLTHRAQPLAAATARGPSLTVADVEPPPALELPRLASWASSRSPDPARDTLSGRAATPPRVLAALAVAGDVTIHAHGIVDVAQPDASFLALSPEADGRYALTVADVRRVQLAANPLVILAACRASQAAPVWHDTWSLPAAFVYAGARAVVASVSPIPDAEAALFFDDLRARVSAGAPAAIALRDARTTWLSQHRGEWVRDVIVFE